MLKSGPPIVVEIGAGQGALTSQLLDSGARVAGIELDAELAEHLRGRFLAHPNFALLEGNALHADWGQWGAGVLAGNLPYYVATALISRFLLDPGPLTQGVFLIQKEVAERITARPGTREYGYFSVECGYLAEAEYLFTVPPGAFRPPPKVESAVVRLTPRALSLTEDSKAFLNFASTCFRMKRKTLRNNLSGFYSKDLMKEPARLNQRAEQISVADLYALFTDISNDS